MTRTPFGGGFGVNVPRAGAHPAVHRIACIAALALGAGCSGAAGAEVGVTSAAITTPAVVINEFTAGSSGWIELYNPGATAADISGWSIDDIASGGYAPKVLGASTSVPAGGYLVVSYAGFNTASTDSVRLVSGSGVEVDSHGNFYAGTKTAGLCFGRQPDGGAWAAASIPCTKGASNGAGASACVATTPATITAGSSGYLLEGTIVTPDTTITGQVLVQGDTITCVATSCASAPGASLATVVKTNGVIMPGMIDAHNHILFDIFDNDDWSPTKTYTNHNQWPEDPRYQALVNAKQYLNGEAGSPDDFGCEIEKYGAIKGLIAGTTSIQGSANPANRSCYGSLARSIDQTPNRLGSDLMQTATIFPSAKVASDACANYTSGTTDAYLMHVGEGVDATALKEFAKVGTVTTPADCLYASETTIIHGTAFGDPEFDIMGSSKMGLVWSPRSNVFLYGAGTDYTKTTDVKMAIAHGINVSLAPDWSIGGSQNILDEIEFAHLVDVGRFGGILTSQTLMDMVTSHPAKAMALGGVIGSIAVGLKADITVIDGDASAPYDALVAAKPNNVRLVMVGGVPLYGDLALESLGPASPGCETIDVCCRSKFLCVARADATPANKFGETFAEIQSTLATAMSSYDAMALSAWTFAPIAPIVSCE